METMADGSAMEAQRDRSRGAMAPAPAAAVNAGEGRMEARVCALYHYPIKSCAGTRVEHLDVVETGPLHDRELMVVDATSGAFLTQRKIPLLALITPAIRDGVVYAAAPGMAPLAAPLSSDGARRTVSIWKDHVESVDQGDEIAAWFSHFLDVPVRVVRQAPGAIRLVDPRYATSPLDQVGFADGYPFLLLSAESLAHLNQRLAQPVPMERFRPNIVIAGCPVPHYEDTLGRFSIGGIPLSAVKPCARCKITLVDQRTAQIAKEPLRTLATYRRSPNGRVLFGMNVIHHATGRLSVDDGVVPLRA